MIFYGREADQPFDWTNLPVDEPATKAFFADAFNHSVGRNGLSISLRNRRGVFALVSFSSDLSNDEWEDYKAANLEKLKLLSVLIDSGVEYQFQIARLSGPFVESRRAVFALGGARQDLPGDCGDPRFGVRQRQNAFGRGPPQVALHELDPRGRRRFRHRRHSGAGAEIGAADFFSTF